MDGIAYRFESNFEDIFLGEGGGSIVSWPKGERQEYLLLISCLGKEGFKEITKTTPAFSAVSPSSKRKLQMTGDQVIIEIYKGLAERAEICEVTAPPETAEVKDI